MKNLLLVLLLPLSSPAVAGNLVGDSGACKVVLMAYGVRETDPAYGSDKQQCEQARKACAGVRQAFAQHCSEGMGTEYKNEMAWTQNMGITQGLASIHQKNEHMAQFCTSYMPDKIWQTQTCNKADEICDDGRWTLSNGRDVTCNSFNVDKSEHIKGIERVHTSVCNMAKELAQRINAEAADRQRMCGEYGFNASVSTDIKPLEAMGVESGTPMGDAGWEPIPEAGGSPDSSVSQSQSAPVEILDSDLQYDLRHPADLETPEQRSMPAEKSIWEMIKFW